MADDVIHISEAEAASDFAGLLARVRSSAEVVIESGKLPVAVIHAPIPPRAPSPSASRSYPRTRPRSWMLTLLGIKDIEAAIESHREPLEPPSSQGY